MTLNNQNKSNAVKDSGKEIAPNPAYMVFKRLNGMYRVDHRGEPFELSEEDYREFEGNVNNDSGKIRIIIMSPYNGY